MKDEDTKGENKRFSVVMELSQMLANTYKLQLETQNYHWNVIGINFQQLHLLFEKQYKEMALAIDEIAERIRALGQKSPGSFKEFNVLSCFEDNPNELDSKQMIASLIKSNETISRKANEASIIARKCGDEVSSGLMTSRVQVHEKIVWVLSSFSEGEEICSMI